MIKDFKLRKAFRTSNMHLFHPVSGIKKYSSPEEILGDFFEIRLEYYAKRKEHLIKVLTEKTSVLETKARFIRMVVDGTLVVFKRARKDVEAELLGHKFVKESFEYLWSLKTYQYTGEAIADLEESARACRRELETLKKMSAVAMWKGDLVTG